MEILHKIRRSRFAGRLYSLLMLLCSVMTGLLPLLLWLLLVLGWYYLPFDTSADISGWTLAALLLSPFAAGFANTRWQRRKGQFKGAEPAFLLWLAGLIAYRWLFDGFDPTKSLIALAAALLLGIAGGLTAERVNERTRLRQPAAED